MIKKILTFLPKSRGNIYKQNMEGEVFHDAKLMVLTEK